MGGGVPPGAVGRAGGMSAFVSRVCHGLLGGNEVPSNEEAQREIEIGRLLAGPDTSKASVEMILKCCETLASMTLPVGAAQHVSGIRREAARLSGLLLDAGKQTTYQPTKLPWARPLLEERAEWEEAQPDGGNLLRTQVCMAADSFASEEWFMGRLFVSDMGFAFESSTSSTFISPENDQHLQSNFVKWADVTKLTMGSSSNEVCLVIREGASSLTQLKLQLGFDLERQRLQEIWNVCKANSRRNTSPLEMAPLYNFGKEQGEAPEAPISKPASEEFMQTASFVQKICILPSVRNVKANSQPVFAARFADATMASVRAALEKQDMDQWPMAIYQKEGLKAYEVELSPWTEGVRMPGVLVRKMTFKIPAPADVPKSLSRMVGLPPFFDSVLVCRLKCTPEEITYVMHCCSLNVPYGDCQKVEDVLNFFPHPDGGIGLSRWTGLKWVKPIPWTLAAAKSYLGQKVLSEQKASWPQFQNILQSAFKV